MRIRLTVPVTVTRSLMVTSLSTTYHSAFHTVFDAARLVYSSA